MSGTTTSATDPGDRSAAEIEREVEATRAGLTSTLEELREKASPSRLFDEAVDWARSSGGSDMIRNLGASVRDNPLPLLLIGAGIGWMMLSGGGGDRGSERTGSGRPLALPPPSPSGAAGGARHRVYPAVSTTDRGGSEGPPLAERASDAAAGVGQAARGLADSVAGAADRVSDAAGSALRSVTGAASSAADSAGSAVSSAADGVGSAASSARRALADVGDGLRDRAGDTAASAQQGIGWLLREQPLVLGAIGVALGAAVGALLPGTEAEDRLMGETRDSLVEQASAVAQDGYEQLKDTAGEHLGRVQQAVGDVAGQAREGLDAGGAGGVVGRVGEALGDAAREARHAVRDAARDLAGEAKAAMGAADEGAARGAGPSSPGSQPQPQPASGPQPQPKPNPAARSGPL